MSTAFATPVMPDAEAFVRCLHRTGTPARVHVIELFLDPEVQEAVCARFDLLAGLDPRDPAFPLQRQIRIQQMLGYDYVRCGVDGMTLPGLRNLVVDGRHYANEHCGPITNWDEFARYPWPDPAQATTRALAWYETHLPDGMCLIGSGGFGHFYEWLSFLMGYETLCYALYEDRALVAAICAKVLEINEQLLAIMLQFSRVRVIWGSDDLGFRTGTLISPEDLRELILPGHQAMAARAHAAGRLYLLHSCGNLSAIMDDLIDTVGIDGKHSFEDTIESVNTAKDLYGSRIALLGGLDIDFLCRADEAHIRQRVRETLSHCLPGGGYCLGTGNSVANYLPLENYLTMLDEGRRFAG